MTKQMEAVLMIARHPVMEHVMMPHIDVERDNVDLNTMVIGKSGGEKAALAWVWAIWKDRQVPETQDRADPDFVFHLEGSARDMVEGFGVMSESLQSVCIQAFCHRHGLKMFSKLGPGNSF